MGQKNSSSISKFLLILLLLLIILPTSFSLVDQDKELGYNCLSTTRAPNNVFVTNRKNLIAEIYKNALLRLNKGFYYTNKGLARDPDALTGSAGVVATSQRIECGICLGFFDNVTTGFFDKRCNSRGVIIWRNDCMLKYWDLDFRGQVDTVHMVFNMTSKGHGGVGLEVAIKNLMIDLRNNITKSKNSIYFATAETAVDKKKKPTTQMYGMAECNGDLSTNDCVKCIDVAISYLLLRFIRRVGAIWELHPKI